MVRRYDDINCYQMYHGWKIIKIVQLMRYMVLVSYMMDIGGLTNINTLDTRLGVSTGIECFYVSIACQYPASNTNTVVCY